MRKQFLQKVTSLWASLLAFAIIFLSNTLIWPLVVGLLTNFNLWFFLCLAMLLNGFIIYLVGGLLQGFEVSNPGAVFLVILILTIIITLLSSLFSLESDFFYIY